jgi:hypothetical protein
MEGAFCTEGAPCTEGARCTEGALWPYRSQLRGLPEFIVEGRLEKVRPSDDDVEGAPRLYRSQLRELFPEFIVEGRFEKVWLSERC